MTLGDVQFSNSLSWIKNKAEYKIINNIINNQTKNHKSQFPITLIKMFKGKKAPDNLQELVEQPKLSDFQKEWHLLQRRST